MVVRQFVVLPALPRPPHRPYPKVDNLALGTLAGQRWPFVITTPVGTLGVACAVEQAIGQ
jgi:hypothetical protein